MKLIKAKVNSICYVLAITDDNDNVLTTSIFSTEKDLESAKTFVDGLLVRLNLLPTSYNPPMITVKELRKRLGITNIISLQRMIPDDEILD